MSYPQPQAMTTGYISTGLGQGMAVPPAPPESVTQVLEQTQQKFMLIETQVDEVIARMFNFPRAVQGTEKSQQVLSASERILGLRSQAMRINEALATVLEKL